MNSTIAHSFPLDYLDNDYTSQERSFQGLSSNDYPHQYHRAALRNPSSGQSAALPINPALKYHSHSSLHEPPFHSTTSPLLSPPDSLSGSVSASGNSLSSLTYSSLPRLGSSNVSTSEHYSSVPSSYSHQSVWNDANMTDYPRPRVPTLHPASLSPPLTFGSGNGISAPYLAPPRSLAAPYSSNFNITHGLPLAHPPANFNDMKPYVMASPRANDPYGTSYSQSGNVFHQPVSSLEASSRSSQTRQEGPPFDETKVIYQIMTSRNHQQLAPEIMASIQKGFFQVEGKWTCYRRNYFTVTCSFNLKNQAVDGPFFISRQLQVEQVTRFAVAISARTAALNNLESEPRSLVQHTPKRDKESETTPKPQIVQPTPPSTLTLGGNLAANNHTYGAPQHVSPSTISGFEPFGSAQHQQPPASYTFERIQFQKATANNGKRRAQQQFFHVVVELLGDVGRPGGAENWVKIATKQSFPMVVRGRSPGHYKDSGRRDSTTSMDPDRGSGAGGDGSNSHLGLGSLHGNQSHASTMDWAPSHRHGNHYGGSAYQCNFGVDFGYSPTSGSSSAFTSSPNEFDSEITDSTNVTPSSVLSIDESSQQPSYQSDGAKIEEGSQYGMSPRKRPFEDDFGNAETTYSPGQMSADGLHPSLFNYATGPPLKAVCAS